MLTRKNLHRSEQLFFNSILFYERGCQVTDCAAATVNCQPASFVEECKSLAADRLATVTSGISLELSNHLLTLRVPVR